MFSGPSDFVLKGIRKTVNGFLPGTVVIESVANVSDGAGGVAEQWTPVTNGTVPGRFNILTYGQIETLALAEGVRVEYAIVVPYNAPLVVGNRILTGGAVANGVYSGTQPYNVRILQRDQSNVAFIKAYCSVDK